MQRARRLAATLVLAACAVTALGACAKAEPGVAAYVGDARITEDRVDALYEDARVKLAEAVEQVRAQQQAANPNAPLPAEPVQLSIDRQQVLATLVGLDVLRSVAAQRGVQAAELPADQVAQSLQLPPNADYVGMYTEYLGYLQGFAQGVQPAELTDADLREVYETLRAANALEPQNGTFENFRSTLGPENEQLLQQRIGLRNELRSATREVDVRVNPRYGDSALELLTFQTAEGETKPLVVLSFQQGGAQPAVIDLP